MHSVAHPWDQACSILQALILPSGRPACPTRGSRSRVQAAESVFKARSTSAARSTLPNKVLENLKINSNFADRPETAFYNSSDLNSPPFSRGGAAEITAESRLCLGVLTYPPRLSSSFQSQMMSTTRSWTPQPRWTARRTPRSTCQDERRPSSAVAAATCPRRRCRFCGTGCTSTASTPTRRSRRRPCCPARPTSPCCR